MANLYAITGTDPNDLEADYSLLISASTPERAVEFWLGYFWDDEPEDCPFDPELRLSADLPERRTSHMLLYRVKHDLFHEDALGWNDPNQMEYLGYLEETV